MFENISWEKALPFVVLAITLILWLPHRFLKKKKKNYVELMKETVWVENVDKVDYEAIRQAMVTTDKQLNTTSIREETYNFFVEEFVKAYSLYLNESSFSKNTKIKKLNDAKIKLAMKFEVPALVGLDEAKDKLEGNVEL